MLSVSAAARPPGWIASLGPGQTRPHRQGMGTRTACPMREYWPRFHSVSWFPEAETSRESLGPAKAREVLKIGSAPG